VAWAVCRAWLWAMGVLVFLLATQPLLPLAAQATHDPPDATPAALADYAAALETAQARLAAVGDDARALSAARRELAPFAALQLPNGETVVVQPLLGAEDAPLTRAEAAARLATARTQLRLAADDQTAPRLARLDPVWQLPEFTRGETLGERFLRWLSELLDGLFPDLQPNPAAQRVTSAVAELAGWAIAAIAALVLLWLLGLWLRRFLGRFVADAAAEQANGDAALPRTPAEARARADELARTGAYRDAVRNLYLAALLSLERRRLVVADRSLTNREVLAQVPAEDAIRPYLRPVVDTFDTVWYGVQEPDAAAFAGYAAQIDGLEQVAAAADKSS
jgi:hypothetical protein